MSGNYGAARVRAVDMRSKQEYARQRFFTGIGGGVAVQMIVAFVLGLLLLADSGFGVRVNGALISSMIATPAVLSGGFALMLKDEARAFGGGVVAGGLVATVLWLLLGWIV